VANALIDLDHVLSERHVRELREVEAARARLAAGCIGDCVDCADVIGFERLMANPVAVRCVECQAVHEKIRVRKAVPGT
jgi:RNA polymerase-binding transcription factor DksA